MEDERAAHKRADEAANVRPHFGPTSNGQQGPDESESVIADNDLGMRGAGAAGESAGAGISGLGGAPGGTPNGGGLGLPGGNQQLGAGQAPTADAGLGGTTATGGLGLGGNPQSGHGRTPPADVLPGGATRPAERRAAAEHPVPENPTS